MTVGSGNYEFLVSDSQSPQSAAEFSLKPNSLSQTAKARSYVPFSPAKRKQNPRPQHHEKFETSPRGIRASLSSLATGHLPP